MPIVYGASHMEPCMGGQAVALEALQERPAALAGEQWEALGQRLRRLELGVQARPLAPRPLPGEAARS